jgi:putative flippase GtrA
MNFRRWGVFNLVGTGGFLLQMGTIALLTRCFHWSPILATVVGLELATLHNFLGHNRFTWRMHPVQSFRDLGARYLRYQIAKTTTLGLNFVITMGLVAAAPLPTEVANTIAVLICALPNYFIAERFVFSRP